MTNPEQYDAVVLGSGEGGKILAWSLASQVRARLHSPRQPAGSAPNRQLRYL